MHACMHAFKGVLFRATSNHRCSSNAPKHRNVCSFLADWTGDIYAEYGFVGLAEEPSMTPGTPGTLLLFLFSRSVASVPSPAAAA